MDDLLVIIFSILLVGFIVNEFLVNKISFPYVYKRKDNFKLSKQLYVFAFYLYLFNYPIQSEYINVYTYIVLSFLLMQAKGALASST